MDGSTALYVGTHETYHQYYRSLHDEIFMQVKESDSFQQLIELITRSTYYLIILEKATLQGNILELLRVIKANMLLEWIPIIVHAPGLPAEEKNDLLLAGVEIIVESAIRATDETYIRIKNLLARSKQFESMSFRDPLTKAYNRAYMLERLAAECRLAENNSGVLTVAFIDADRFKQVNDTYGHAVGDLVLIGLYNRLKLNLDKHHEIARFGGEEFIVMFPGENKSQAQNHLQRVLQSLHDVPVAESEAGNHFITFSGGVAEWKPGMQISEVIKLADEAVYDAKNRGRNQVIIGIPREERVLNVLIRESKPAIEHLLNDFPDLNVVPVKSFKEAQKLLRDEHIALCIFETDFNFNAFEIKKHMGQRNDTNYLFIYNGPLRQHFHLQCKQLQINSYLSRPYTNADVTEKLKALLSR
ncbi:GGDEF domain-containing protein [Paenibacillus lutrae]|uniref:Diguanylate cyclase n=1 Tax=Paenibacillus lutrae TaxID=2078573 RepID=A0A7X3K1A4_9BACL|nr:diguanylate cyclase [Paenibacillus lutrae]MVP02109.1 diguanylate cyclase [Paenibacillus lutrae]